MKSRATLLCAGFLVTGCATVTQGTSQMLTFSIEPQEARCALTRADDGVLGVVTPNRNVITVSKDRDDIVVSCNAPGYKAATRRVLSSATGSAIASVFLLDFGITDLATGAFWKYPESHDIALEREEAPQTVQARATGALAPTSVTPSKLPKPRS
jgi:hypothetical protein